MAEDSEKRNIGRRRFLKSFFGLGAIAESESEAQVSAKQAPHATSAQHGNASFFWANLRNGHVGFPTGTTVPSGMPGSLMKLVTAATLLESGQFGQGQKHECRGLITIHNQPYACLRPHGSVDITQAIGFSCNAFFATAAQHLNAESIIEYARQFGLNAPAAGYAAAAFPSQPSHDSISYALGLAPDLQPNALQIMRMVALVGLSGTMPQLYNPGEVDTPPDAPPFQVHLKENTWRVLQQGMRLCAREGTSQHLDTEDKMRLAAKTGTTPHGKTFQSWVAGYFPFDKPHTAFCLRSPAGTSQDAAVPAAHKWLFSVQW